MVDNVEREFGVNYEYLSRQYGYQRYQCKNVENSSGVEYREILVQIDRVVNTSFYTKTTRGLNHLV